MTNIQFRLAKPSDATRLLEIYRPYVEKTEITFEYRVPSSDEFRERISKTLEKWPFIIGEKEGQIIGYAYASQFRSRAAFAWSVETSIYLDIEEKGKGQGILFYQRMERILQEQGVYNINACITYPNPQSIHFHEKMGYQKVAHFTKAGFKLGHWWDLVWYEKLIAAHPSCPEAIIPITALKGIEELLNW